MNVHVLDRVLTLIDGEGIVTAVNYDTKQCDVSLDSFEYKTYYFDEVAIIHSPYDEFYEKGN